MFNTVPLSTANTLFYLVIIITAAYFAIAAMATALSSNWKALQSTLKKEKTKPKAKSERALNTIAKRRRIEQKEEAIGVSRRKMAANSKSSQNSGPSASLALWAEDNDISAADLAEAYGVSIKDTLKRDDKINEGLAKDVEIGQFVSMDCEMVGVGGQEDRSVLARVSIVNFHGTQIYDSFVKPKEFVTDWRTHVSGVSSKNMATARSFEAVQKDVATILQDRVLVGHAIKHDLDVMMLGHPKKDIRDTSRFSGFRKYSAGRTPSLKKLAKEILGVDIQGGEHSSVEDARATMLLFRRYKSAFDVEHSSRYKSTSTTKSKKDKSKK